LLTSSLSLCRGAEPHAGAAAVLVDELDAPFFSLQFQHLQGHFHEMQGSPSGCWVKVFVLQGVNDPPYSKEQGEKHAFAARI
jgi:hypothetical protein